MHQYSDMSMMPEGEMMPMAMDPNKLVLIDASEMMDDGRYKAGLEARMKQMMEGGAYCVIMQNQSGATLKADIKSAMKCLSLLPAECYMTSTAKGDVAIKAYAYDSYDVKYQAEESYKLPSPGMINQVMMDYGMGPDKTMVVGGDMAKTAAENAGVTFVELDSWLNLK